MRPAGPADAAALQAIGRLTFTETFGSLYPPADLDHFLETAHGLARIRADLTDPAKKAWLVEAGGQAIGYALAGPCKLPHPGVTADCGEVERLYLARGWQGGGLGSRLLAAALAWLEGEGLRPIWIGVWSENLGAQRLYARHGFEVVGSYEFEVGETRDHELIMLRR